MESKQNKYDVWYFDINYFLTAAKARIVFVLSMCI